MGVMSWLFGKGLAGSISRDLCTKYLGIKNKFPGDTEEKLLERVWNFWLTLNEDPIRTEDGENKIVRLEIIKEKYESDKFFRSKSLMDIFKNVLYIETEIGVNDGKIYDNALKVFVKVAREFGLDFTAEYEGLLRTMGYMGLRK